MLSGMSATLPPDLLIDLLIEADTLLPMTPGSPVIADGAVAIADGRLVFVGPRSELSHFTARRTLRFPGGTVTPGLINLHAHLPHSLLLGAGDGLPVAEWLHRLIFPIERRAVDAEFVRVGAELALAQALAAGVTLSVDMFYFEEVIANAVEESGARAVLGQTVIGFPSPDAADAAVGLQRAARFLSAWRGHPRVEPAVAPHSAYTNTTDTLRAVRDLCQQTGARCLIHLSEAQSELAQIAAQHGTTPIAYVDSLGLLDGPVVAAHVIYPDRGPRAQPAAQPPGPDVALLARKKVAVAHCPQSNLHMGEGIAPVRRLLDAGVAVGLGTDGAGSAPGVDLLADAALAGRLMKTVAGRPDAVSASALLHLLTAGAAAALGRSDLGTLSVGSLADVVVFEPSGPLADPLLCDPYALLVYASAHRRVALTVVDGQVCYERGAYPRLDVPRLAAEVAVQRERMRQAISEVSGAL